MGTSSGP